MLYCQRVAGSRMTMSPSNNNIVTDHQSVSSIHSVPSIHLTYSHTNGQSIPSTHLPCPGHLDCSIHSFQSPLLDHSISYIGPPWSDRYGCRSVLPCDSIVRWCRWCQGDEIARLRYHRVMVIYSRRRPIVTTKVTTLLLPACDRMWMAMSPMAMISLTNELERLSDWEIESNYSEIELSILSVSMVTDEWALKSTN